MGGLKRIIFTVTNDLSYDQRMQKICRSLCKAGYDVELVGRKLNTSIPFKGEPFRQKRLRCLFNKGKLFYVEYNLRLLVYLLLKQFDALCAIDLDTISPVYIAGKLKGARLIYDAHEYFTEVPEVINRPLTKFVWKLVERTFVPRFDLFYTVSPGLAALYEKQYGKQVDLIMNVPLLLPESEKPLAPGPFILYQGALNTGRGLERLLGAMMQVDCKLVIAGEGDLSKRLRELAANLNLKNKVEFKGSVKPAELLLLTRQATIGINLLENKGLSYYYSLANKFFDYIHAGIPQVCIDFPEYRLINDKYHVALLIAETHPEEISGLLNHLLQDTGLYASLQKNCNACKQDLNWQKEEAKLLQLYARLWNASD
jgi:glycosyltransferase involved in cell wall biosynthesis